MKRLICILILFTGCHHYKPKCNQIYYNSESCGDHCIPTEIQARAIERFIKLFSERHGHGTEIAKALRSLRVTWVEGDEFFSEWNHMMVTGVSFNTRAIKLACRDGVLGHTAFCWELMNVSLWTIHGHHCENKPEWTEEHSRTISLVDAEFQ
jgi:hypothetical protein